MTLTIQEIEKKLKEPFPLSEIKWKPQAISRDKTKAMAVPFIDARAVMERLDTVVGAFNWQIKHIESESTIGIRNPETGEWIWKGDVGYVAGEESDNEDTQAMGVKGSASDGLKRAGVVWGIFRYSYDVPKQWVKWDADGRKFLESPTLPNWALPEKKNVAPAASNSNTQRATANNTQPTQTNRQGETGTTTTETPTTPVAAVASVPSPIKAPTIKNVADWKKVVAWAVEQKYIANENTQMELFKITNKAGITVIDESNIKQVTQLINDAFKKKA